MKLLFFLNIWGNCEPFSLVNLHMHRSSPTYHVMYSEQICDFCSLHGDNNII